MMMRLDKIINKTSILKYIYTQTQMQDLTSNSSSYAALFFM